MGKIVDITEMYKSLLKAALAVVLILLPLQSALAACPTLNPSITHRTSISYCELCGTGQVTIRFTYPSNNNDPDLTSLVITEDLQSSGLTYIPNTTSFSVRDGAAPASFDPAVSGANGSVLTWDLGAYVLDRGNGGNDQYLEVSFEVRRANAVTEEGLSTANRNIIADIDYATTNEPASFPAACTDTEVSGQQELPLREPNPVIDKRGRNVDANQSSGQYANTVYGHNNDDIIWRIRIQNTGLADMQDVRFDDLMQSGNLVINYACSSEGDASTIANNNGGGAIPADCVGASNNINDFVVTDPFGDINTTNWVNGGAVNGFTRNLNGREIDVDAGGYTYIYLVGKIIANGSCISGGRSNTVSDFQYGCEADSNGAGGISDAAGDTVTLRTYHDDVDNQLTVQRAITGINTSQPVGSRGYITVTITNNTGGTVKDILLDNILPAQYVVDPTYWSGGLVKTLPVRGTPVVGESSIDPLYGTYPGMIDRFEWTNPQGSLVSPSQDPLLDIRPTFRLFSSTTHSDYADQENMLRHGDELTLTFPIVLISQDRGLVEPYDLSANLDVTPEVNGDGTDPAYTTPLSNTLTVDYDTFCATQGNAGAGHYQFTYNDNNIAAFPEDLDVAIGGTVFILTNDTTQQLTLPVEVTNNGGHDASDYHLFVTFGATINVVNAPMGCSVASAPSGTPAVPDEWQPALFQLWQKEVAPNPINIPSTATVYECTTPTSISPGQTVTYDFDVVKTTDAARIAIDDLTFRADVVGEITLDDGTPLWFPTPIARADGLTDLANNYSMDAVWARVVGFNLRKTQLGACSENLPATFDSNGYEEVQIGEECTFHIETGGWFGFETPGFAYIAVQNIDVVDEVPDGQAYISNTDPYYNVADPTNTSTQLITGISLNPGGLTALTEGWFDWRFNVPDGDRIEVADEWFRVNVTTRLLNKPIDSRAVPNVHTADSFNVLNSTFDATFSNLNTGVVERISLGPTTVGYPNEPLRRVDLTVTEPNITVTKEACNETLSGTGTGAACTPFSSTLPESDGGDTQDSYVYRIRVENELESGAPAVTRAPAYNVVVTDTLDASDLMLVVPFENDGLDNDADGSDEAGAGSEGSISENQVYDIGPPVVNPVQDPAVLTFSHTHSTALEKINPGSFVYLYYRVDPDDAIAPLQTLTNTAYATYDSLEGQSGNQTEPAPLAESNNGELGGARLYTSATDSASIQMAPLQTYRKTITRLANKVTGLTTPDEVSIGEEIEYELRASIPAANLEAFEIHDTLPAGISCSEAPTINLSAGDYAAAGFFPGGSWAPTCNDNEVSWYFGPQEITANLPGNSFDFRVKFIVRVDNTANVNNADIISNGTPATNAYLRYENESGAAVTLNFDQIDVEVKEPNIVLTKTYEAGNHDAGNIITVTVTAENTGTASAYNLRVFDDLDAVDNLTFLNNVGGTDPPDNVTSYLGNSNRPIFSWNTGNADYAIAPGETKTFTFEISVDTGAQPHEILDNTIQAAWQSLPGQSTALNTTGLIGADGSTTGMRNGTIPNNPADTINDYETTASASSTVPALTMTKSDLDNTQAVEVGVHKNYQIVINLPEGTTNNLIVNDQLDFSALPSGISYVLENNVTYDITYTFNRIDTINGLAADEANFTAFPADGTTGTAIWNIGTVVTDTEDDTAGDTFSPSITINYYARINNDTNTNTGSTLQNQVTTNYYNVEIPATPEALIDTTPELTVTESILNVTKTATLISAAPITAGDVIEYVITIPNSGNATAYDLNIVDTLPANFALDTSFTPTATINAINVAGFNSTPSGSPNGPLIWGRGNADNSLDIPAVPANPLILTYRVIVEAGAESNVDHINSVIVDWTSLDNTIANSGSYERTGAGCPTIVAPDDYCVGPVTSTVTTADTNSFTKAITFDSYAPDNDATVRVGDEITYRLSLNLQEGTTRNVNVQDVLPTGLEFVRVIRINGDSVADYTSPSSGQGSNFSYSTVTAASLPAAGATGTINFTLGDVVNDPLGDATTDTLVIEYQARVLNNTLAETPTTQTLVNTGTLQFVDGNGAAVVAPARLESSATLTVLQPELIVTKTEAAALVNLGAPVSYTINVLNSGDSPAYNLTVTDVLESFDPLPGGMCDTTPTITSVGIYDNIGPALITNLTLGTDYTVNYSGCTLTLTLQSTTPLIADNNLIITYDAQLDADTPHGSTLTNVAGATQWFSQDAASATTEIQTYSKALTDGTVGTADHEDASSVTTGTPTVTIEKDVVNVTTAQNPGVNATPGDILRYTITITNTSGFELYNFSFTDELDDLNASARFVANTLNFTSVPAGADITNTDAAGGAKGTGLVDVRNLNLGIGTVPGDDTLTIEFEVELVPSIPDTTIVLNQGHMLTNGIDFPTDDPNDVTASDPTETLISSAPDFVVEKISTDLTGDPNILLTGDTLRYTITVKNTGTEDTVNTIIRDQLPANTTYVAGSTTLNGNAVTEPVPGTLPLQAGILINTPVNTTAGDMIADGTGTDLTTGAVATIIFDVTINSNVVNGTIISNQAYVSADGIASGAMADTPSDDPGTPTIPNDPTRDVVGDQPLLDAHKTASISYDANGNGFLDIGDEIRYTITISNTGAVPATGVSFTDAIPTNTQYVDDSVTLNTLPVGQPDGGVSPLIAGIPVSSSDLTPPLPTAGNGIISVGQTAVVTFDVRYDSVPPVVNYISNQGFVYSNEQPVEPTDADGIDSNGDQPTLTAIGNGQLLTITKSVSVVGGGPVLAGGQLEYRILVTNISTVDATNVEITDNLNLPVAGQLTYVAGSGLLNGLPAGVSYSAPVITADYDAPYGNLLPGQTAELVFRVDVNNTLPIGTTITNTGTVEWNAATQTDSSTISVDVGGTPGVANVNGKVWHDKNYDNIYDSGEVELANWYVDIYRNATLLGTVTTDANGNYSINGLIPNYIGTDRYDIRFRAPGSNSTTAKLGMAYSDPALTYINALHRIYDIVLNSGANVQNLNLPIDPNGVVYNSVTRAAVPGATISLLNAGTGVELSSACFDDVNQQNQVTTANGYYKFDLNFSQGDCAAGGDYLIQITEPATDYSSTPSTVIPPQTDATTLPLDVPSCPGTADDDVAAPAGFCEVQPSELAPALAVAPASPGTSYYLHLTLDNVDVPGDSQIFNNHLPIDPILTNAVAITKTSAFVNVTRGKLVPYTITFTNSLPVDLNNSNVVDNFPAGFKYVAGSARYNNGSTEVQLEPVRNGLTLTWGNIDLPVGQTQSIKLLLIVGAAVTEGPYTNKAYIFDTLTNTRASGIASATVRVTADPDFDCSDVIGKVFDDKNLNGYQDDKEPGLAGVKLVTVRGLVSTSDKHGRFHVTCAVVPNEDRGTNFVIKLDERSLPTGYRVTTENPRVQRVTRGKMAKFNFGSALHRVVSMDIADGVFAPGSTEMNSQWKPRIDLLIEQLKDKPSILRLSYLADVDNEDLVEDRLAKVKQDIIDKWLADEKYKLTIETEIFWRRGGPPEQGGLD